MRNRVSRSDSFRSIFADPGRELDEGRTGELVELLTDYFRAPGGTWSLLPAQALAIAEAYEEGGLFAPIPVGGGKTLISLLLATLLVEMGEAKKPLLLVPASLAKETRSHRIKDARKQFRVAPVEVLSYSILQRPEHRTVLDDIAPDAIICDEVHYLKNMKSTRTKRVAGYLKRNPECRLYGMSGSITNGSLMDYWHLGRWCLRDGRFPLPSSWYEVSTWAEALDARPRQRADLGAFETLLPADTPKGPEERLRAARLVYGRRLRATPGVVSSNVASTDKKLAVTEHTVDVPASISDAFDSLRRNWEVPGGKPLESGLELWAAASQLASGFVYEWDPAPPEDWLAARRAWASWCRYFLGRNKKGIDSPFLASQFAEETEVEEWLIWKDIAPTFEVNPRPRWFDDFMIAEVKNYLHEHRAAKPMVWLSHRALADRLVEEGVKYFGPGDEGIERHDGPCAASIAAHGTGKNLQQFHKALVVVPPASGTTFEQLLGRHHRLGQESDVEFAVCLHTAEYWSALHTARARARNAEDTTLAPQRLNLATISMADEQSVIERARNGDPLWASTALLGK